MRSAALLLILGGCQVVFTLDEPEPEPCVPIGHDEDGDDIDDACDLCPQSGDDLDGDGDGVGDSCDPKPNEACEQRARFDGFGTQPVDLVVTAPWIHDGDDMLQPDPAPGLTLAHYPSLQLEDITVRASITILAFFEGADNADIELGSGGDTTGTEPSAGYACTLHHETEPSPSTVELKDENPDIAVGSDLFSGNVAGTFTFELVNARGHLECTVVGPQGRGMAVVDGEPPMANGEVFLVAGNVSVRVHWVDFLGNTCAD